MLLSSSLLLFLNIIKSRTKSLQISPARSLIDCPTGERLKICRPSCEPLCSNQDVKCKTVCSTAKCICMEGFARHDGICVPKEACQLFGFRKENQETAIKETTVPLHTSLATAPPDVIIVPKSPPPKCRRNQLYSLCVCDSTCAVEKKCTSCIFGCGCFPLYVRNSKGHCIPKRKCSKKITPFGRPSPILKLATITITDNPTPPPSASTSASISSKKEMIGHSNLRAPPAITPFIFYRHKRIERKKKALRQLLKLIK